MMTICAILALGLPTAGQDLPRLFSVHGQAAGDLLGRAVSGVGDINNDGHDDFIVGIPQDDTTAVDAGAARVFSGLDGSILHTFHGTGAGDWFGYSVSGAGDVNADGVPDIIVGAPYCNPVPGLNGVTTWHAGCAFIFSGLDGSLLHVLEGVTAGDEVGSSVDGADDVNADGHDDIVVGLRHADYNGLSSGAVEVYSGLDGSLLYHWNGDNADDHLGECVSGLGDVNNDGFADIIAGARKDDDTGTDAGSARIFSGADGSILLQKYGVAAGNRFGSSVSRAGDANADGHPDFVVGAKFGTGNDPVSAYHAGTVHLYSGLDGSELATWYGETGHDNLGISVGDAGDVNGDGHDDIIAGANGFDAGGTDAGKVYVYSGFDGSLLAQFVGDADHTGLGCHVNGAGDVNGDGFDDVIAGSGLGAYCGGAGAGSASVFAVTAGLRYGVGNMGTQTLSLGFATGLPGNLTQGNIALSGPLGGASVLMCLGTNAGSTIIGDVAVHFDTTPGTYLLMNTFFDNFGDLSFFLNLSQPLLAGQTFFLQAVGTDSSAPSGLVGSNGLGLLFTH